MSTKPDEKELQLLSPTGGKKHVELSPIHDFAAKLVQPEILPRLKEYVLWQARRRSQQEGMEALPDYAPVSINLDLTTACNYACDHCVDMNILNQKIHYHHENLLRSLELMVEKGLRSVIVIGGGEPTLYRKFQEVIQKMKEWRLQVAIVSNGAGNKRIAEVAPYLEEEDWVRLSLDAGSDEVFQAMHKPRKRITLDEICEWVPKIKAINPRFKIGFSFIITWKGASINDAHIIPNIDEIYLAAERAKKYQFDYIAFKPFLTRADYNNAEIVDLKATQKHFEEVAQKIESEVERAKALETDTFKVYKTTNLKVLLNRSAHTYMQQPRSCHMQFFRQVLSPLGMYNCPVYRNQSHGCLGHKDAYASEENFELTKKKTAQLIEKFDASRECREVTCLYNHANWWMEELIRNPQKLEELEPRPQNPADYFL
ncbi:MAG: radical SAM protein [Planctomycetota bacterium]|nr:MAG: radical SAM protein [Planctomycetota bacterium]